MKWGVLVKEGRKHTPLSLVGTALSRMLLLSKASATRKNTSFLSIRHTGQAANPHSICPYKASQFKVLCGAYRSPQPSTGLQAASWLGCPEPWAADQSLYLPGTCCLLCAPTQAHCKLAASSWDPLSAGNGLNARKKNPPHNTAWMILIPLHKDSDCRRKVFQFCLTYICKTLAIGTRLSIAWVCQICCPPPRTVCVCSAFSGLSFTGSYSNMAVGMLLQQGFLLTALRLSSIRKPAEYTSGLWLRWLPPCRAISMLYLKWFTDTPSLKLIQRETLSSPWSWFPCMCMDLEEHIMLYSPSCYIHLVFQLFALHIYLLYLFLSTVFCRT